MVKFVFYHEAGESLSEIAKLCDWDKLLKVSKEVQIIKSEDDSALSVTEEYRLLCQYINDFDRKDILSIVSYRLIFLMAQNYDYETLKMVSYDQRFYGQLSEFSLFILGQFDFYKMLAFNCMTENFKHKKFEFESEFDGAKIICKNNELRVVKNDVSHLVAYFE